MLTKIKENKIEIIILSLIIILGLLLRVIPALRLEFWLDEALNFFTREQNFIKLSLYDPLHPPLYFWLIKIWSQFGTTEFFLRFPSLLFSFGSLILVYLIAKSLKIGKYFPFIVTLFFSLSLMNIDLAFQVRMYSLVTFWMLLSLLCFVKILFNKNQKFFITFCLANFLGILTDYAFIWYFLSIFFGFLVILFLTKKKIIRIYKEELSNLGLALGISSFLMLTWLPFFILNLSKALEIFYSPSSFFGEIKGLFLTDYTETSYFEIIAFYFLFLFTNLSSIFLLYISFKLKKGKLFFFWLINFLFFYLTIFLTGILSIIFGRLIITPYRLIIATFFPIFSLAGLVNFLLSRNKISLRISGFLLLIVSVLIFFISLKDSYFYNSSTFWNHYSYKDAAEFARSKIDLNKDKIFLLPPYYQYIFNYYFYEYDKNKLRVLNNANFFGGQESVNIDSRTGGVYWLINIEEAFINKKEDKVYKFFLDCDSFNNPIYFKKAVIYRCQI